MNFVADSRAMGDDPIGARPNYAEAASFLLGLKEGAVRMLRLGEAVPRRLLDPDVLRGVGEPLDGPDLALDETLAVRVVNWQTARLGLDGDAAASQLGIVTLDEFVAVDEPGAEPLVGDTDGALIPESGDVMFYGDGGAGKTTLAIDLACHLAAGDPWLGQPVARPARVLLVENEGPRPLFRAKLRRKRAAWTGSPIDDRIHVLETPWARLNLEKDGCRQALANAIAAHAIDVVIVGPLTRTGMNAAGTLQEVRDFMELVAAVRYLAGRRVTFILIHHENKGGQVSGAWEGAGDTLFHVTGQGHGRTRLYIQKARWASAEHGTSLNLLWTDGEGFTLEEKPELDDDTIAASILDAIHANPGVSWGNVEKATPGVSRDRRMAIRDRLFAAGRIVNVAHDVALAYCPERKTAHLHRSDDPTIAHLLPASGADGEQIAPAWGANGQAHLLPAPPLKEEQRSRGAVARPPEPPSEELWGR